MGKEYSMEEALRLAIEAEKESMDFYTRAADATTNERAKKVFQLLAGEEADHLKAFFGHYRGKDIGSLEAYAATPPNVQSPTFIALERAIDGDTHEKEALEIAMKEEKATIDRYTVLARDIIDPLVRSIFEKVIRETQKHYELIEAEYAHIMTMVHDSDQNIYVRE